MKKFLALILAVALCLSAAMAVAEENTMVVDLCENGAWVPFTDYGFQICMPADWLSYEINEEQAASGVIFSTSNPEATRSFTVAYSELEEASDIQTVGGQLAETYANVSLVNINDMDFITYSIEENDVIGLVTLGGSGVGLYQFVFYPASDNDYGTLALQIAASISVIEE